MATMSHEINQDEAPIQNVRVTSEQGGTGSTLTFATDGKGFVHVYAVEEERETYYDSFLAKDVAAIVGPLARLAEQQRA